MALDLGTGDGRSVLAANFPWASLLRGVLGRDEAVLVGIARLAAPGATISALVSVIERDGVPATPAAADLARAYERHGLRLAEARPATAEEVGTSGSSWAKRLRAGRARPVTLLQATAVTARRRSPPPAARTG